MDRRAVFFLVAAGVCALLVPLSDPKNRWVAGLTAIVYLVLAVLSALDHHSRSNRR
jgi:uncharacterized membrane protein YqjE